MVRRPVEPSLRRRRFLTRETHDRLQVVRLKSCQPSFSPPIR